MQIGRFTPAASTLAGGVEPTPPVHSLNAARLASTDAEEEGTIVGAVPPAPTAEARELVDKAAERVQELRANNRELHFSRDEASNRVVIEVRDLEGNVLKTIPPSKVLDVMSGAEL